MSETLKPETAEQVLDAVKWAAASESPLAVKGQGSKEGFGRAIEADCRLDLSGLTGIGCYEPNELFMTAGAATTLAEIEAALRAALTDPVEDGGAGLKPRVAFGALRPAVSGRRVSPPLFESMEILGKASTLARLARLRTHLA